MYWLDRQHTYRYETHFGDRVVRCIADRPATFTDMFAEVVEAHPESEALVSGDHRLCYRELDDQARRMAAALSALGVQPGDRVVLNLGNGHEFPIAFIACLHLRAIAVPVGTRQRAPELEYIYNDCDAKVVFVDSASIDVQPVAARTPGVKLWISCGDKRLQNSTLSFTELLQGNDSIIALPIPAQHDCLAILYTSGTTGQPKGAMLTHLGMVHTVLHWTTRFSLAVGERTIITVPISHVTGLGAQLLVMFGCGGAAVMQREFEVEAFLALAQRERLSYQIMVPAMYKLLLLRGNFDDRPLSDWKIGAFGGAPMPQDTIVQMAAQLPHLYLANGYGATETTSPSTMMPLESCRSYLASVGTAVDCCDLLVMDDEGCQVATGQSGEIWLAGPHVIPSYWNRADANTSSFVGRFWRSGDIGSVDHNGFVKIFDRKKDMINRGGYKIFSAEVENVISDHADVDDVALVPVYCAVLGQRSCAFVCSQSATFDRDALAKFLHDRVADYKIPDYVHVQQALLPRNANGKIQKRVLADQAAGLFAAGG